MEEKRVKFNSKIIIYYLYIHSILVPLSILLNESQLMKLEILLLITISIYSLYINDMRVRFKMVLLYITLLIFFLLNIFIVDYKQYVYPIVFTTFLYSFIPIFIIGTKKIKYRYILNDWFLTAQRLSIIYLPIFFILRTNRLIGYFEVAQFVHLNSIILFYFYIVKGKRNIFTIILIGFNFFMLLTMGSRMVLIATLVIYAVIIVFLNKKNKISYYVYSTLFCGGGVIAYIYLERILIFVLGIMQKKDIPSRNIVLLLEYVQGTEIKEISSGRDYIYPIAKEFMAKGKGFPQGLGVIRNATNGQYYHAHNIFFEMVITFGLIFVVLFFLWYLYKFLILYKYNQNSSVLPFFLLISVPYFIRALVGTYFLTDSFFLVAFSILFWIDRKEIE